MIYPGAIRSTLRSILVVAHPGHELRLYGWCSSIRPTLFTLTDGSRSCGDDRRSKASRELATSLGMGIGTLTEPMADCDAYQYILAGRAEPFLAWVENLADWICVHKPRQVVTDAWQGYNPSHDLTHAMARCAVAVAASRLKCTIELLDYAAVPMMHAPEQPLGPIRHEVELDESLLRRKWTAIESYPDIETERDEILACEGFVGLRIERLHAPRSISSLLNSSLQPAYERYGEARVRSGLYQQVLRRSHVINIVHRMLAAYPDALAIAA